MFSQNSSFQDGFNFPDTVKQLTFGSNNNFPKFKRRIKQVGEHINGQCTQKTQTKKKNNLYSKIQVVKKVGLFLEQLKAGVILSKPNLKPNQLMYLQSQTKQDQKQSFIHYQNYGVLLMQILVVMILWLNIWQSSYQIIFSKVTSFPIIEIVTLGIYGLYIYCFLNTELKNEKLQLISHKNIIFEYYINERFLNDCIIIVALTLKITPLDQYQPLFIIFRLATVFVFKPLADTTKKLQNIISISTDAQIFLSISSLFFKIFLLLHGLSLIFASLSFIQKRYGIEVTWVQGNNLSITSQMEQYIVGWYWGATVLTTIGFGEITPVSNYLNKLDHNQRFFCSFIMVMCCMIFGYFVNYIGSLINMVGQSKKIYEKDMRKLNRYLLKQNLPDQLKSNIRSHFFNKNKIQEAYDPNSEETIINKLTSHLTSQITEARNKSILMKSKFIQIFSNQTVRKLSLVAKKMVFAPEQIIFSQRSKDMKLWILQDGIVEELPTFFNQKQDKPIAIYEKNQQITIGWINFLTEKPYRTMARAKTFTLSYEIKQEDFYRIIRQNTFDFNKMHQLKQNLIENKRNYINRCLSCQKYSHNVIQCPRVHFKSRKIFKILIQQKKQEFIKGRQDRKKNATRSRVKLNWKSFENFSQYTPEFEGIVFKYNTKSEFEEEAAYHRTSMQSFVHFFSRNKSTQQEKLLDKRLSDAIQSNAASKNSYKVDPSQVYLQISENTSEKIVISNFSDKIYLGEANRYLQQHNFSQISKKYLLYIINLCTNRNKIQK